MALVCRCETWLCMYGMVLRDANPPGKSSLRLALLGFRSERTFLLLVNSSHPPGQSGQV